MKKPTPKAARAAALKYDGENAPTLVAKGYGELAEKIIETAKQNEVHIHNDPLLLEVLARLDLGEEIPEPLYIAVAKIIAFAYFLQGKCPDKPTASAPSNDTKLIDDQSNTHQND
ncbi:EscU/YscU/HrcU family type III secretion system export apparatus switch protein [Aliikangiella sp. IMCC44632]